MAKRLDRIIVVDVESTCWEGTAPAGEDAEIIEIGICALDVGPANGQSEHAGASGAVTRQPVLHQAHDAHPGRRRERHLAYPFGPTHINVKNLLALSRRLQAEVGMDRGLEILGLPLEGTHHRGVDDAWNIAAILAHILRER